jgi:hypothetical protein
LALAFLASAGMVALLQPAGGGRRPLVVVKSMITIFGLIVLGLFVARSDFSRARSACHFRDRGLEWKTLRETTPCLPVRGEHRRQGIPLAAILAAAEWLAARLRRSR